MIDIPPLDNHTTITDDLRNAALSAARMIERALETGDLNPDNGNHGIQHLCETVATRMADRQEPIRRDDIPSIQDMCAVALALVADGDWSGRSLDVARLQSSAFLADFIATNPDLCFDRDILRHEHPARV